MASRNTDMQAIFSELSEKNKDIVILIAKSVKVAQEVAEQPRKPPMQTLQLQQQEVTMNENQILEQLKREALYAQRSFSTELLYQTYGKAQMARQLEVLTQSEFMEINHMTVHFMNTDREYISNCNRNFREGKALT